MLLGRILMMHWRDVVVLGIMLVLKLLRLIWGLVARMVHSGMVVEGGKGGGIVMLVVEHTMLRW